MFSGMHLLGHQEKAKNDLVGVEGRPTSLAIGFAAPRCDEAPTGGGDPPPPFSRSGGSDLLYRIGVAERDASLTALKIRSA